MTHSSTPSLEEIKQSVLEAVQRQRQVREARQARSRAEVPPASNTGGKSKDATAPGCCHLDTLTFTLEVQVLGTDNPALLMHDADAIGSRVEDIFLHGTGLYVGPSLDRRMNGYSQSAPLCAYAQDGEKRRANLGFVAWGGNCNKAGQDTMMVHLTGEGCEHLEFLNVSQGDVWHRMADAILDFSAKITRIDIAYDDLDGDQGGISAAVGWYKEGRFTNGGRPPSVCQHGDWINGHSRTFEVGQRRYGKMLRIYEKGHQLGDKASRWVRYELQLGSRDRNIPPMALLCLDELLAGSSPAMGFIRCCKPLQVPTIVKAKMTVALDHLTHYASVAYGRLLNVMHGLGHSSDEILESLRVEGMPRRLSLPPAAYG